MNDENADASVREMSQVKDAVLQQALQQVKFLKAKLQFAAQVDSSKLREALGKIDDLTAKLNLSEQANRKLQHTLHQVETLNGNLQSAGQDDNSTLEQALQQVEALKREVQWLERENARLIRQAERKTAIAPDSLFNTSKQLGLFDSVLECSASGTNVRNSPLTAEASSPNPSTPVSSHPLTAEEKVALFGALFAGRRDAYAVRWENESTGASGYQPARDHDYSTHTYDSKKKRKVCKTCPDLALTNEVLKHHLQGKLTVGVYPLLEGDLCSFLAIDLDEKNRKKIFRHSAQTQRRSGDTPASQRESACDQGKSPVPTNDAESWKEDARSLLSAARMLSVPAYIERSRSGKGGHLWIFFEDPVTAGKARRLGEALIAKANQDQEQIRLSTYDRMFPNQDTLPERGYGNLIVLPLQKKPLSDGNSAFLDENLVPHSDQWQFLQSIQKVRSSVLEDIVKDAGRSSSLNCVPRPSKTEETDDKVDPWALPPSGRQRKDTTLKMPLPAQVNITLGNFVYISKEGLRQSHINRLEKIAAFQNPKFYENQALRFSNHDTPRIICCAEEFSEHLGLPRGCLEELKDLLETSGVPFNIEDKRFAGNKIKAKFTGKLRPEQKKAAQELLRHDNGVLFAVTGFGKTVLGAYCISKRKTNTLVLVHRQQLLQQWKERLSSFLELPPQSIGQIGAGKRTQTGIIDIAMVQSLYKKGEVDDLVADYGHVIVDECHGAGAVDFEQILRQVKARWILGLTATPVRYDGHHPIVVMQCGPIRYRVRHGDHKSGIAEHVVMPRITEARLPHFAKNLSTQEIISALANDELRNEMIIDDVLKAIADNRTPLVLTKRKEHLQLLSNRLEGKVKHIIVYKGGLGLKKQNELRERLKSVPSGEERVVLAIGDCIGEGFDDPRLDTLFLTLPISWRGRLVQYAGRLHRAHEGKSVVQIYDYVDVHIEKILRMFKKRQAGYKEIGYATPPLLQAKLS